MDVEEEVLDGVFDDDCDDVAVCDGVDDDDAVCVGIGVVLPDGVCDGVGRTQLTSIAPPAAPDVPAAAPAPTNAVAPAVTGNAALTYDEPPPPLPAIPAPL